MQDITVADLKDRIDKEEKVILIDVREPYEFEEFSLTGAENIPLGNLMNVMDDLLDTYKDSEVIVSCRSGNRSGMAKQLMVSQGFSNVRNLLGGVMAWKEAFGS